LTILTFGAHFNFSSSFPDRKIRGSFVSKIMNSSLISAGVLESMGQQEKAGEKRTDSIEQVTEAGVLVESKGQEVKANDKTPDSTEQVAEAGELVESKGPEVKANDKTPDSTEQVTEAAAFSVETKKSGI
jgi:hypothetical protein